MSQKSYKVMIVDDSPAIHALIERAIVPEGFVVCAHARNGKQALELFQTTAPDLITMDITMPVMDGLTASSEILKLGSQVKILMLSAIGDIETMEEARRIGVKNFISKPFNDGDILQAVKYTLEL